MPHELNPLYNWATRDVLGSPSTLTEDYLKSLKESGVICGGGEEEKHYRVELPRRGERICELNLEHPRVPHKLWVNEVMFTEFGVRIPFTHFQQRLLQRCFIALSQFHPNAWLSIWCFELVTEYLELPQDPEVFLYLLTVFSPNAEGKTKKGYMSVRPGKYRKIFGLYEESFHDFKGRYFKVFAVGDHPPFWLTLERNAGRFPSYWSKDAGLNYVPVSYKRLNDEQKDTADILLWLFSKRFLKPKAVLGNPERTREEILNMAGGKKSLALLRQAMQQNPQGLIVLDPTSGQASSSNPEGGGSSTVRGGATAQLEISSPIQEEGPEHQVEAISSSPAGKMADDETTSARKRLRTSDGFIENNFMGPCAVEALRDYDPMESVRWVQWAMLRSATILKSVEPQLSLADHWERRCSQLTGEMKLLDQRRIGLEKEKADAEVAKANAEKDLEASLKAGKEKDVEVQRLKDREINLLAELESAKK
ncbi:hypothetical protein PIB30_071005 [Stylosanthes scabra]|uniref:Transposase (Putative), gypsy type n=1 Tax=Stylosanthes scabra TaxID=79078 RepID=A0ABU6RP91_9FABA|nr:hypothetical protein [Stylosanthes scabra]